MTHLFAIITPLPDPPFLQVWALERPLPAAILLIIVGLLIVALLARRSQARLGGAIGAVLVLAGLGVFLLGAIVTTERERVIRLTHQLVDAAETGDSGRAGEIIGDDFALAISGTRLSQINRDVLLGIVENFPAEVQPRGMTILETQAVVSSPIAARTQFRVRVISNIGPPSVTWWRLDWRRGDNDEWILDTIDWQSLNGRRPGVERAADVMRFAR